MLRCYENDDITHVHESVDPVRSPSFASKYCKCLQETLLFGWLAFRDLEVIETELMMADIESLEKRMPKMEMEVHQKPLKQGLKRAA